MALKHTSHHATHTGRDAGLSRPRSHSQLPRSASVSPLRRRSRRARLGGASSPPSRCRRWGAPAWARTGCSGAPAAGAGDPEHRRGRALGGASGIHGAGGGAHASPAASGAAGRAAGRCPLRAADGRAVDSGTPTRRRGGGFEVVVNQIELRVLARRDKRRPVSRLGEPLDRGHGSHVNGCAVWRPALNTAKGMKNFQPSSSYEHTRG